MPLERGPVLERQCSVTSWQVLGWSWLEAVFCCLIVMLCFRMLEREKKTLSPKKQEPNCKCHSLSLVGKEPLPRATWLASR